MLTLLLYLLALITAAVGFSGLAGLAPPTVIVLFLTFVVLAAGSALTQGFRRPPALL